MWVGGTWAAQDLPAHSCCHDTTQEGKSKLAGLWAKAEVQMMEGQGVDKAEAESVYTAGSSVVRAWGCWHGPGQEWQCSL